MSFDGDTAAGVGAMFVSGESAWMDFGATSPEYRMRGSQGAILERRMQLALNLGCRWMYTCTGVDVPGDPQHSYKNIRRAGFEEAYLRANWAPPRNS